MPELPEVEIIKRELKELSINKKITNILSSGLKLRKKIPSLEHIIGQKIVNIHRRNKYLILETQNNWIVIHLGMTGQFIYSTSGVPDKKHIHFQILLSNNTCLYYLDPRRFGLIDSFFKSSYPYFNDIPLFKKLGIEPLGYFEEEDFLKLFTKKRAAKNFLLDGSLVCGLGNIYANEILFLSNIHPMQDVMLMTILQRKNLYSHIKPTLYKAIRLGGSSISDYVHTNGTKGEMQNFYNVYGRNGKCCNVCNSLIDKIMQSGRSSFFCPTCQPFIVITDDLKIKKKPAKKIIKKP